MNASTGKVYQRQPGKAVPDQYIVVLKDDVDSDSVPGIAAEMAKTHRGTVGHVYQWAIKGFSATMSEGDARALSQDARVAWVEEDGMIRAHAAKTTSRSPLIARAPAPPAASKPGGTNLLVTTTPFVCASSPTAIVSPQTPAPAPLDRIDKRALPLNSKYRFNFEGTGVNVYVIDSGIDIKHQEFLNKNGTASRASFATKPDGTIFDASRQPANGRDINGHGTLVASVIGGRTVGVAKNIKLISVKVLDDSASGFFSNFIAGIDYVFRRNIKPAVANLSLGESVMMDPTGASAADTAVRNLIGAGVSCVISAPDANIDASLESPGRVGPAITVGATDPLSDERAGGFGFGPGVDLYAPGGMNVCAAIAEPNNPSPHGRMVNLTGGTSLSAPLVTGVAAMYLQKFPAALPAEIRDAITTNATPGVVKNIPATTPNRLLFSNFL